GTVNGSITWSNNTTDPLSNVEIDLKLDGPMLSSASVESPDGFYQSSNSTLQWTSAQEPALAQVAPGASGTLNFSFDTLSPGASGTLYTNPTIALTLSVTGTRQGQSISGQQQVSNADTTKIVFASAVALSAQSFYSQGPFQNSGPTPPRAESPTTYTIVW